MYVCVCVPWISMFFFLRNSSPLFSVTRSSSFSVVHVSVNIKNNAEKDTNLLLLFLSNSPGGHVISFQIKPWVAFGLPFLLIELFYIGMPVVPTDGRAGGRSVYGHVISKFSRMGRLSHFLSYGAPPRAAPRATRVELRYKEKQLLEEHFKLSSFSLKIYNMNVGYASVSSVGTGAKTH